MLDRMLALFIKYVLHPPVKLLLRALKWWNRRGTQDAQY